MTRELPRRNLLTYLSLLPAHGERIAYRWKEGVRWRTRTYRALHARALGCAARLLATGLQRGDAVVLQGSECADWVEGFYGVLRAGGVVVPLDHGTAREFRQLVATKAHARFFVGPPDVPAPDGVTHVELGSWDEGSDDRLPEVNPSPQDRAEIIFTSGTTGDPKGVLLTHGNLTSDLASIESGWRKRKHITDAFPSIPLLSTLPLSHMFGQAINVFLAGLMGLTIVFTAPRSREVLEASRRHKPYGLICVPRVLDLLSR